MTDFRDVVLWIHFAAAVRLTFVDCSWGTDTGKGNNFAFSPEKKVLDVNINFSFGCVSHITSHLLRFVPSPSTLDVVRFAFRIFDLDFLLGDNSC